jgi:hypothetical protein
MNCEGKTGAFCLPILQITWETLKDLQGGGGKTTADGKKGDATTPLHQHWAMSFFDRGPALAVTPDGNCVLPFQCLYFVFLLLLPTGSSFFSF